MAQLVPTASALPGYGTARLPWTSNPSIGQPYVTKDESHRDSCDGIAGTEGWSPLDVQAAFSWTGSPTVLFASVGSRMAALGWRNEDLATTDQARWTRTLTNGSTAQAALELSPLPPIWMFTATAPPAGKAASGC